jgi:hypothetical protein
MLLQRLVSWSPDAQACDFALVELTCATGTKKANATAITMAMTTKAARLRMLRSNAYEIHTSCGHFVHQNQSDLNQRFWGAWTLAASGLLAARIQPDVIAIADEIDSPIPE